LGTGSETVHEFGGIEIGIKLVSDVGSEPLGPHVFEDFLKSLFGDFDRVADVMSNDEPKTPSEPIEPLTAQILQPEEEMRKKRVKITAGRTDLPLVRKFLSMQSKPSDSPSQPKFSTTKPSAKPTRKSFRIASQSTFKAPKPAKPSD